MRLSYAQNCEDLVLEVLLADVVEGFYVDVGANDPDTGTVTRLFYERGWRGINIEPVASLHRRLEAARPRDVNLNIGIAAQDGELELREYQGDYHGWSTFSAKSKELEDRQRPFRERMVRVRRLADVFEEHLVDAIDFLKVDVEGFEHEVLVSNDWDRWRPKVVVVENTPGPWRELLASVGYGEAFFDGLNRYYVTADFKPILPLREYNDLIETYFQRAAANDEALAARIVEHPEDYISHRRLWNAAARQLRRGLAERARRLLR
jgi:FkbM family methyltransferase